MLIKLFCGPSWFFTRYLDFFKLSSLFLVENKTVGQILGGPTIIWQNKFGFKKKLGPPKKLIERNVCPEKRLAEILRPPKSLGQKQIWNLKIISPFWIQPSIAYFGSFKWAKINYSGVGGCVAGRFRIDYNANSVQLLLQLPTGTELGKKNEKGCALTVDFLYTWSETS